MEIKKFAAKASLSRVIISLLVVCTFIIPFRSVLAREAEPVLGTPTVYPISARAITALAYSDNGRYLALGHQGYVDMYNFPAMTLAKQVQLPDASNVVDYLKFSPDNKYLGAAIHLDQSSSAYVWQIPDWSVKTYVGDGNGNITGIAWAADSSLMYIGRNRPDQSGNTIFGYNLDSVKKKSIQAPELSSLVMDGKSGKFYIGGRTGFVYRYKAAGDFIDRLQFQSNQITGLAFNQEQGKLLLGDDGGNIVALDLKSGDIQLIKEKMVSYGSGLSISPDGSLIAFCTAKGNLAISSIHKLEAMQTVFSGDDDDTCQATAFAGDGATLVAGFSKGSLRAFPVTGSQPAANAATSTPAPSSTPTATEDAKATPTLPPTSTPIPAVLQTTIPQNNIPAASGNALRPANIDKLAILEENIDLEDFLDEYSSELPYPVTFNTTLNTTLLAKDRGGDVRAEIVKNQILNLLDRNKQIQLSLTAKNVNLEALAFHPSQDVIAAGADDGTIFVWDTQTGLEKCEIFHTPYPINTMTFNHQGTVLAVGYNFMRIELFSFPSCKFLAEMPLPEKASNQLAFSPDDKQLVSVSASASAQVFDVPTVKSLYTLEPFHNKTGLYSVTFSPDQNMMAVGSSEGIVTVWNSRSKDSLVRLTNVGSNDNPIYTLMFSKDGSKMFACMKDNTCAVLGLPGR